MKMRTEKQIYDTILNFAKADDRIRVVTLEGSRTNINIIPDDFQDYDITFFVTDMQSFINSDEWLNVFGERLIMQKPEDMELFPKEEKGYSYLMLFWDGVKIDLIVRGICCLIPNQPYSKNIRITRIVDSFLEHARVWYFGNGQNPRIFIGSPDWMYRNLFNRIETVCPVNDPLLQLELEDMLNIQLKGNWKTCWVDEQLRNCPKGKNNIVNIRPQYAFYDYLKKQNEEKPV